MSEEEKDTPSSQSAEQEENQSYKRFAVIALRLIQLLTIAMTVTGFIWASSDYLLATVLVEVPVTPLSVLLMLYGSIGSCVTEGLVRVVKRKKS